MSTERRAYPRMKVHTPIEVRPESSNAPIRAETSDLSVGGCYVEMIFPLAVGTDVEVNLRVNDGVVTALGKVKTCDPQVGNGIEFIRTLPEDRHLLAEFLKAAEEHEPVRTDEIKVSDFIPAIITASDRGFEGEIERFGEKWL